jgi:aldehyde dehydrogenase (NAD+)
MEEAAAIAKATAEQIKVGDPSDEGTQIGPLVSETQFNKVQALIQKGIDEGATLQTGGVGRPDGLNRGYFVKPTIFSDVKNDMTIAQEEIFGPVLSLIPYADEEEAVEIANDTVYGLAAYVSSGDLEHAAAVGRKIRAGNVHLNGAGVDPGAPFGGYKQSGNGREFSKWGLEEFLETKALLGYNAAG